MLLAVVLLPPHAALQAAQTPAWQAIGPLERDVTASALVPGLWYASLRGGGTYLSRDGGTTWVPAQTGLPPIAAGWIGIDPVNSQYALAFVQGLPFSTSDGGRHWHRSSAGLPSAPGLSTGLYSAAQIGLVFAGGASGLFESHDGGLHWKPAGTGIPAGRRVTFVTASPRQPRLLLAGTSYLEAHGGVLYLSSDGGATWQQALRGLPPSILPWQGFWSQTGTQTAWVAAGSLYRTADTGEYWNADAAGLPPHAFIEALAQLQDGTQFVQTTQGLYRRASGSVRWQPVEAPWPATLPVHQLLALPGPRLLALTAAGMYVSDRTGSRWQTAGAGLPGGSRIQALAIGPRHGTVYAGGADGVWSLTPGSDLWRQTGPGLPIDPNVHALLALPAPHASLLCATDYGVFVNSTGSRWALAQGPLDDRPVAALAYASGAQRVYAAPAGGGLFSAPAGTLDWQPVQGSGAVTAQVLLLLDPAGSWILADGRVSRDGGRTWSTLKIPAIRTGTLSPAAGSPFTVVLGTAGHGVYRSDDGGLHWQQDGTLPPTATVSHLVGTGDTILAEANNRMLQGTFTSDRWQVLGPAPAGGPVTAIQALAGRVTRIAAGTAGAGIYLWHAPLHVLRITTSTPLPLPTEAPTATMVPAPSPTATPTWTSTPPALPTPMATSTITPTETIALTATPTLTPSPSPAGSPSPGVTAPAGPTLVPFSSPTPMPTSQPAGTTLGAVPVAQDETGRMRA